MTFFMGRLRPRDRRAILAGLSVLLLAGTFVFILRPYAHAVGEARDQLAAERALLARERALLRAASGLGKQQAMLDTAVEWRSERLFTGDRTLAAAQLARYLDVEAGESRALIERSETIEGAEIVPGLDAVRLRFRAVGDVAGVLELVRRLEDGDRLVRIETLSLGRRERRARGPEEDDPIQPVTLAATITGYTLRLRPEQRTER